jgi:cellulose synthase/poly-beta-1,6-N-acetylglucosamine synthase-like glycosyltransferase
MSEPTVCCVMLVNGRDAMIKRAIASFRAQTYDVVSRWLLILNTGEKPCSLDGSDAENEIEFRCRHHNGKTIGALRNIANACSSSVDLIAHWDSDDWSHPRRLEEEVALLEATGKQLVGYRELLFWDTRTKVSLKDVPSGRYLTAHHDGEAWLYRNPDPRWVCGASMLYRREAWEECPFDDAPHEDQRWWLKNAERCIGVSALQSSNVDADDCSLSEPRMICGIHGVQGKGGNTEAYRREDMLSGGGGVWQRAPQWDSRAGKVMAL